MRTLINNVLLIGITSIFFVLVLGIASAIPTRAQVIPPFPDFLDEEDTVTIEAFVASCELEIVARPEKRIPSTGNWGTSLTVELYRTSDQQYLGTFTAESDDIYGRAIINICDQGLHVDADYYDLRIRGKSHLWRTYQNIRAFESIRSTINLSTRGLLFAGETSIVANNYINVLDISTQITTIFTADNTNDLNQDGYVNVLDLSNTITNFFLSGD